MSKASKRLANVSQLIPIELVEPHPDLQIRFEYGDVEELAALIEKDGMQLQAGRVVPRPDGKGYHAYIGIRRLLACKLLFKKMGWPTTYSAYIDEGLSKAEALGYALAENASEKGERKEFSLLEEIAAFGRESKLLADPGASKTVCTLLNRDDRYVAERLDLAKHLSEEKLRKLYEISKNTGFRFKISHLQKLAAFGEEKDFFMTASLVAGRNYNNSQLVETAHNSMQAALTLPWFAELFPEYAQEEDESDSGGEESSGTRAESLSEEQKQKLKNVASDQSSSSSFSPPASDGPSANGGQSQSPTQQQAPTSTEESSQEPADDRSEPFERDVIVERCPRCKAPNPFTVRGLNRCTVVYIPTEPGEGKADRVVPDCLFRVARTCHRCSRDFFFLIQPLGGQQYAVAAKREEVDLWKGEKKKVIAAVELDWDEKRSRWITIRNNKEVGVITPDGAKRSGKR